MKHAMIALLSVAVTAGASTMERAAHAETPIKIGIVQATSGGSAALYGLMQKNAA